MNEQQKISDAMGGISDRLIREAYEYKGRRVTHGKTWKLGIAAAGICIILGAAVWMRREEQPSVVVYAADSDLKLAMGKTILLPGRIQDNGNMNGHPLMFYILGDGIGSIRFSCKNEWISFMDWTEQRGNFGLSKNFTVRYGERAEEYYYLVVDWVPQNVIRKLTDHKDIGIAQLPSEEKEDVIVMEVRYLDGRYETLAVHISLDEEGQFSAIVSAYEITDEDEFVYGPDSLPIERPDGLQNEGTEEPIAHYEEGAVTNAEWAEPVVVVLSSEELAHIDTAIQEYYNYIHRKIIGYVQVTDTSSYGLRVRYEGYAADEVVVFEVTEENSEIKRSITIGSKDGWNSCEILNEGY